MVRQSAAERSPEVALAAPLLAEALGHVGHPPIRNSGTVGGSIAHADPAAELPAVVLALDAELVAVGAGGARTIPAAEFFRGPFTTALEPGEILTEVRSRAATAATRSSSSPAPTATSRSWASPRSSSWTAAQSPARRSP